MRARPSAVAGLLLSVLPTVALIAATHIWSGFGVNPNWSNGFNWSFDPNNPGLPPFNDPNGVFLQFPAAGVLQHTMNQDIVGLTVNSITFNGPHYTLNGGGLSVNGSIDVVNDPNSIPDPNEVHVVSIPLVLAGQLNIVVGPGTSSLRLQGAVSGPSPILIQGGGITIFAGNSTYTGPTLINAGTLVVTAPAALGSGVVGTGVAPNATLRMEDYNQQLDPNDPGAVETIFTLGGARLSALGTNTLLHVVLNPGPPILFDLAPGAVLNLTRLEGNGTAFIGGGGRLRLTGPSPFTGQLRVFNSSLIVNGSIIAAGPILLEDVVSVLGGTGTVGSVQVNAGAVSPGESAGILSVAGSVTYASGPPASLRIELDGLMAGSGYDRLSATGIVALGTTTSLVATRSFLPPIGSTFTIVSATGGVSGTFVGLPNPSQFQIQGQTYQIDYTPTSVVLTALDEVPVTLLNFTVE